MCMRLRTTSHFLKREVRSQVTAQLCQALEILYLTQYHPTNKKRKHTIAISWVEKTFSELPKGGPPGSN